MYSSVEEFVKRNNISTKPLPRSLQNKLRKIHDLDSGLRAAQSLLPEGWQLSIHVEEGFMEVLLASPRLLEAEIPVKLENISLLGHVVYAIKLAHRFHHHFQEHNNNG